MPDKASEDSAMTQEVALLRVSRFAPLTKEESWYIVLRQMGAGIRLIALEAKVSWIRKHAKEVGLPHSAP